MTRLEWTDPAIADLEHIHDYIARDSPQYAVALVERLITSTERIKSFPNEAPTLGEILTSVYS